MVKKAKAKGNKKTTAPTSARGAGKAARPTPKAAAKYEQPGAPWWKKLPLPEPH